MTRSAPVVLTMTAVVLGATLTTRAASATPLCDPDGHVCIQIDTTSAIVCTPLRPGGWTPASCNASDGDLRKVVKRVDEATHGGVHAVDALIARFDELAVTVMLFRRAAEPEATGDAGARAAMTAWTQILAGARPAGDGLVWLLRVVVAAAALVGIGWLVGRLRGRRRAFDSQDLWPR